MKRFAVLAALFLGVHTPASQVLAGVADSPLPVLEAGKTTLHLYSVPGIMGELVCPSTYFSCTSMDTVTMRVGVEIFFHLGGLPVNDAVATSLIVGPGQTVLFGTSSSPEFPIDSSLGGLFDNGSARILSTSKKLACTAFIADRCNNPVKYMRQLTIIRKTTQKAAN